MSTQSLWTLRDSTTLWLDTSRLLPIYGFGYFETHVWTPRDYWVWTLRNCFSLELTKMKILRNMNILLLFSFLKNIWFKASIYHYNDILRISRNYIILSKIFQTILILFCNYFRAWFSFYPCLLYHGGFYFYKCARFCLV